MARRSFSLPGRPSRLTVMERKRSLPLPQRKQVHWSTDLEEVIYFAPDNFQVRELDDGLAIQRPFDRRVKILRSQSTKTLSKSKRRPLKATQTLAKTINDANSVLIRTGMNLLSQDFDRFNSRSENLELFDEQSNKRWKDLLANYQQRIRNQLEEQEEQWV